MRSSVCFYFLLCAFLVHGFVVLAQENMLGNQSQNEGFYAVPSMDKVVVDGDAQEWDLSGQIQSFGDFSIRNDYSIKTAAMWDDRNLYLFFEWRDPQPLNSQINGKETPDKGWRADAEQLRIKAGDDVFWLTFWSYLGEYNSLEYCHLDPTDLWNSKYLEYECMIASRKGTVLKHGVESAYRLMSDGKGFTHEVKIPWSLMHKTGHSMKGGDKIRLGLEFLWGDKTGKGWPAHKVVDNMQPGLTDREFYWVAKDVWGDLTLSEKSVPMQRRYVPKSRKKEGTIAVETEVPMDVVSFTLAIDDENGNRIRNLVGGESPELYTTEILPNGKRKIGVMWDGKDHNNQYVNPGKYKVRGLFLDKELKGQYEMGFYNPGTPPWATLEGTGDWGADHYPIRKVISSGEHMILVSDFAEGGTATFAVNLKGQKMWGEIKGASFASANGNYFYSIPNDWGASGSQLLRLHAKSGKFASFVQGDSVLPMPLNLVDLYGIEMEKDKHVPKTVALAATDTYLLILREDGMLYSVDPETGKVKKRIEFKKQTNDIKGFKIRRNNLYYFEGNKLYTYDIEKNKHTPVSLEKEPSQPIDIAIDNSGNLYIADIGQNMQVTKYTEKGKLLNTIGKEGGRARAGKFEKEGMLAISSIEMDSSGKLWVAECSLLPRRVSVWATDGTYLCDYIGNTAYSGAYAWLHDNDPSKGYVEGNELSLDKKNHTWEMERVIINPQKGDVTVGVPMGDLFENGHVFYSEASGKKYEYLVSPNNGSSALGVFMRERDEDWKAVSGVFRLSSITAMLKGGSLKDNLVSPCVGEYKDLNPADLAIWSDKNGDGKVQRKECEIVPAKVKARIKKDSNDQGDPGEIALSIDGEGWYRRANPKDLSFLVSGKEGVFKVIPDHFTGDGAPVYSSTSWEKLPLENIEVEEVYPILETTTALAVGRGPGLPAPFEGPKDFKKWFFGFDTCTGKILWKYPSPYHQVHGSHSAPMPSPGLVIGATRVCGIIPDCGDAPAVFLVRGNLGEDYWFTTDGLYVSSFFKDCRLPGVSLPDTEEELRKMQMGVFSGSSEHFCGWAGRQEDGAIRMTCSIARQTSMIVKMEGLENIHYIEPIMINVTNQLLHEAKWQELKEGEKHVSSSTLVANHALRSKDGRIDWANIPQSVTMSREGLDEYADVKLCWDKNDFHVRFVIQDSSPWRNEINDFKNLFKGGDAVDVCIRPSAHRNDNNAVEGDVRFVCGPFNGANIVVEMREKASGHPDSEKHIYSSPVSTFVFESVIKTQNVQADIQTYSNKTEVTLAIPWTEIGINPQDGVTFKGDFGVILSNREGNSNVARIYWNNKNTNLIKDIPHEAKLEPSAWGEIRLVNGIGPSVNFEHGKLQVSKNKRYLEHADGTPFFYLADTAWELFHRLDETEIDLYLENRRAKGFTVIQAVILAELDGLNTPNANGDKPFIGNNVESINEDYFKWIDKVIRMAEKKGLYIGLLPTWGDKVDKQWGVGPVIFNPDNAEWYGRWLAKRYANFKNIIWINGGDRWGGDKNYPVWDAMGKALRKYDGNHLITFHPQGECSSGQWFHSCDWLDFNMSQTGHCQRSYEIYERLVSKDYNRMPIKPCLDGEPRYENHPICWKPDSLGWFDEVDVRQAMYWSLFSGSMGHTYGCHDIWQMLTPRQEPIGLARGSWKTSLDLPGAQQLIHARRLMERYSWEERRPVPEIIRSNNTSSNSKIVSLKGPDFTFVYFPNGETAVLDFNKIFPGKLLSLYWMDPRSGNIRKDSEIKTESPLSITPPSSGRGNDWVLICEVNTKESIR